MKHYYEDGGLRLFHGSNNQARVLIELQARKTLGGRGRVPDIELAERDRLAVLVQTMNKRGV